MHFTRRTPPHYEGLKLGISSENRAVPEIVGPIGKSEPVSIVKRELVRTVEEVQLTRYVQGAQLGARVSARSKSEHRDVA